MAEISRKQNNRPGLRTDNSLKSAFTTQAGDRSERVSVKRDGRALSYEELERMSQKDLVGCEVKLFDRVLTFRETRQPPGTALIGQKRGSSLIHKTALLGY